MIGELGDHYPKQRSASDDVVLEVERISTTNRVQEVSFTVRRGEVFGIGGVLGVALGIGAAALGDISRYWECSDNPERQKFRTLALEAKDRLLRMKENLRRTTLEIKA